jgi:hypothetical protein
VAAAEAQLVAQMVQHLEDKADLVLAAVVEETVVLEHSLDLAEEHLVEVMEHLHHLVALVVAVVVAEPCQEIQEQVEE